MQKGRALTYTSLHRLVFEYEPKIDYSSHAQIVVVKEFKYCHAIKYKSELVGLYCAPGKVLFPPLNLSPDPLKILLAGATSQSKIFLNKIRKSKSWF